ncbi:MAG TPA: formylglycine-generating enzyme family protein [Cyanobacteria bacterium UBA8803]|nr:formylglycine-generating enzyme family protein [Cyanobacteria bacterium UBA9273]HBL59474.1 formylglycine-generating enzyme family protein [Cyanobacteria bacterium UBA8803]
MLHPRLKAFAKRFGQTHINLACHAAFPLALTPELLYCLRENFQPDCDWIAVADLLLSLCNPVGYELYEMTWDLRHELLLLLKANFGEARLSELSDFMAAYIRLQLLTNDRAAQDLGAAPHWTALAYTRSPAATADIARVLKKTLEKENPAEWVHLTPVLESYAECDPLLECGFEPLLVLSRGWEAKARGDEEAAAAQFNQLGLPGAEVVVAGVPFKIPSSNEVELFPTFEFEVVTVNRRGEIIHREIKQAKYFTQPLGKNASLEMVYIPGGTFLMGSPEGEGSDSERPQHLVTVQPFFMSKYPITQAQWRAVAALPQVQRQLELDPSDFKGADRPIENVDWSDAVEFCERLSRFSQDTGRSYRLPSEAEWEYACRAGTTTPFHFGETITTELANYRGTSTYADGPPGIYREETTSVGSFPPNAFGLYDMHGNVWEWCADSWHDNYERATSDGSVWRDDNDNQLKLLRGGSWDYNPRNCRSASRGYADPGDDNYYVGFRVVCELPRTLSP